MPGQTRNCWSGFRGGPCWVNTEPELAGGKSWQQEKPGEVYLRGSDKASGFPGNSKSTWNRKPCVRQKANSCFLEKVGLNGDPEWWFPKWVPWTSRGSFSWMLLEMHVLRPHPRPTDLEAQGQGQHSVFSRSCRGSRRHESHRVGSVKHRVTHSKTKAQEARCRVRHRCQTAAQLQGPELWRLFSLEDWR